MRGRQRAHFENKVPAQQGRNIGLGAAEALALFPPPPSPPPPNLPAKRHPSFFRGSSLSPPFPSSSPPSQAALVLLQGVLSQPLPPFRTFQPSGTHPS